MSKLDKSLDLDSLVSANNATSFKESVFKERELLSPRLPMYVVTLDTSLVEEYLGQGGHSLNAPFMSLAMVECWPIKYPSTCSWAEEIEER